MHAWDADEVGEGVRAPSRPSRLQRIAVRVALFALVLLVSLAFGVTLLAHTEVGRGVAAEWIEQGLSDAIPGFVTIGELERLGTDRTVVHDLRFHKPDGRVVIHTRRAEVDVSMIELFEQRIAFERAHVDGGLVDVTVQPDGRTGIEAAFSDTGPSTGVYASIALRSIHVKNLKVVVRPSPDFVAQVNNVQGIVEVSQSGPPGVQVRLHGMRGHIALPKLLGATSTLRRADGWIHGGTRQSMDLAFRASLNGNAFAVGIEHFPRGKPSAIVTIDSGDSFRVKLIALGAELKSWGSSEIEVRLDPVPRVGRGNTVALR